MSMHQPTPTEFDDAVERYRAAEREFALASEALRTLVMRKHSALHALKVALALEPSAAPIVDIGQIQKAVADHYALHPSVMTSQDRPNHIAHPRQVAMTLARELTKHSLEEIGAAFGGRDHGTVIYAIKAVTTRADVDAIFAAELKTVRTNVRMTIGIPAAA